VHKLRISVSEILGRPGEYRDVVIDAPVPDVATALAHVDQKPVNARLRLESVVEGILVTGPVKAPTVLECARCLEAFSAPLQLEVCELFSGPGHAGAGEDDAYPVADEEIDLEPMLRDSLALELPLRPLCRPDCKGYCPQCGADLNAGACDCRDDEIDPRWADLAVLREKLA
jgi:DUF177 domain-containing protein